MRVYHFTNLKFGMENLRLRRLKVATISDLNDPFDFLALGSSNRDIRKVLELVRTTMSWSMGLLCFSRNWANPVQWTHYADGHRGICFGFDVPDRLLRTVRYQKKRPLWSLHVTDDDVIRVRKEFEKLLTVKYQHWRYEQEERNFVPLRQARSESSLFFVPFSRILELREVIVGCRCDLARAELTKLLGRKKRDVVSCKARLSFHSFRVVRQRDEQLWD